MRSYIPTTKQFIGFGALLLAVMLAAFSFTQNKPSPKAAVQAPQLYRMTVTQVPSATVREWENFQKNDVMPMMKKIGVTDRTVFRTASFGVSGEITMVSPVKDLAQFDANPIVAALGQEGANVLMAKGQRLNASSRSFMLTGRPDLGIAEASGYVPKLGIMMATSVAPNRTDEYEKNFKEVLPVIRKTNAKGLWAGRVGLGGDPNEYRICVLFDSFADLGNFMPGFTKAMAEAKLAPMPAGIVMHSETSIARFDPELSIRPLAQKTAK